MFFCFFFYCYGDPRDLHSFPTRRSSDLASPPETYAASVESASRKAPARPRSCAFPDRKSTRLNSSHEWISYAVFCLKKKKKLKESARNTRNKKSQKYAT